jgi:hypothetical protein
MRHLKQLGQIPQGNGGFIQFCSSQCIHVPVAELVAIKRLNSIHKHRSEHFSVNFAESLAYHTF